MRDICGEARLANRYFYEHFASTAEAYEAVFEHVSEHAATAISRAMMAAKVNSRDLVISGLTAFFYFVKEDPRRAQILLVDASSHWRHMTIKNDTALHSHALLMLSFSKLIYPHMPKSIRLEVIGSALIGATLHTCLTWAKTDFKLPVDTMIQHLMFVWDALDNWVRGQIKAARHAEVACEPSA
jgi:AcrR family transcriptional regulator